MQYAIAIAIIAVLSLYPGFPTKYQTCTKTTSTGTRVARYGIYFHFKWILFKIKYFHYILVCFSIDLYQIYCEYYKFIRDSCLKHLRNEIS